MIRSKGGLFVFLALMALITGIFTTFSTDIALSGGDRAVPGGLVYVNGEAVFRDEFTVRMATVEQNLLALRAQVAAASDPMSVALLEVMESTAVETIALASLMLDYSVYQHASGLGLGPDPEQVRLHVIEERLIFETIEADPAEYGASQEDVREYRAYIDTIGEERYWSEFYPQVIQQQLTVQQYQSEVASSRAEWIEVQREIFGAAEVELINPTAAAPATVDSAREYMETVWEIVLAHAQ